MTEATTAVRQFRRLPADGVPLAGHSELPLVIKPIALPRKRPSIEVRPTPTGTAPTRDVSGTKPLDELAVRIQKVEDKQLAEINVDRGTKGLAPLTALPRAESSDLPSVTTFYEGLRAASDKLHSKQLTVVYTSNLKQN